MNDFAAMLIMYVLVAPILPITFGLMASNATPKKNIVLGVTLPEKAHSQADVLLVCKQFKKQLLYMGLAIFAISLLSFVSLRYSVVMAILINWIILVVVAPFFPYYVAHKKLKTLKKQQGWAQNAAGKVLVDTALAQQPLPENPLWWYLPPFLISLVPVFALVFARPIQWASVAVFGTLALIIPMSYGISCLLRRQRTEVVDVNTSSAIILSRVRQLNFIKLCLYFSWISGIFNICMWLFLDKPLWLITSTVLYTFVLIFVVIAAEIRTRKAQKNYAFAQGGGLYADEDVYWLAGIFYHNPNDTHNTINDRVGMGITMNMAKPLGKIVMGFSAMCMLALWALSFWLLALDFSPISLRIKSTGVEAWHVSMNYAVEFENISKADLLQQLPPFYRISGNNMGRLFTGKYRVEGMGEAHLCLNTESPPFLNIEANGERYILNANNAQETLAAYEAIMINALKK